MIGGKVIKSRSNVVLTTAYIRTVLGCRCRPTSSAPKTASREERNDDQALAIRPNSAFDDLGFAGSIDALVAQTQELYLADDVPWVVGYSGGKDSTAVLQLVWRALAGLAPEQRTKPVHVITTDTLVENPVVAAWVTQSLDVMAAAAEAAGLADHAAPAHPDGRRTPSGSTSSAGATPLRGRSSAGAPSG